MFNKKLKQEIKELVIRINEIEKTLNKLYEETHPQVMGMKGVTNGN
jgi:hypothetical protein